MIATKYFGQSYWFILNLLLQWYSWWDIVCLPHCNTHCSTHCSNTVTDCNIHCNAHNNTNSVCLPLRTRDTPGKNARYIFKLGFLAETYIFLRKYRAFLREKYRHLCRNRTCMQTATDCNRLQQTAKYRNTLQQYRHSYRVAKTHRMPYLRRSYSAKKTYR